MFQALQTIQFVMRPVAESGLCLHVYPNTEEPGHWVAHASSLSGKTFGHSSFPDTKGILAVTFPPEGGKFLAERLVTPGSSAVAWKFTLMHGDTITLQQEYPPATNLPAALKGFFSEEVLGLLTPHIQSLLFSLMRMGT